MSGNKAKPSPFDDKSIQTRLHAAAAKEVNPQARAEAAIWAAVLLNVGMGVAPFGVDIAWFFAVLAGLIVVLGEQYGFVYSKQEAGQLVKEMFKILNFSWAAIGFGLTFMGEALKGVGVLSMGGVTPAGMALNGVLAGAVTYAAGYTVKKFLENNRSMSAEQMRTEFRQRFAEGRVKAQDAVKQHAIETVADIRQQAQNAVRIVEDRWEAIRLTDEQLTTATRQKAIEVSQTIRRRYAGWWHRSGLA
jgi:uncharacterized protein (DUF697 family)